MADESADRAAKLRTCLKLLSNDEGVKRPDAQLNALLLGELAELRKTLRINLDNGVPAARSTLVYSLNGLIHQLTPRRANQKDDKERPLTSEDRQRQYKTAVAVSLNIFNVPNLRNVKLQERRKWLAERAEEENLLPIAVTTCQRDFDDAVAKIAAMLAAPGYVPPEPVKRESKPPKLPQNRRLLIAGPLAAVVILTATFTLIIQRGHTNAKSPGSEQPTTPERAARRRPSRAWPPTSPAPRSCPARSSTRFTSGAGFENTPTRSAL